MQRDPIFAALLAQAAGGDGFFVTVERRLRALNTVNNTEMPYLAVTRGAGGEVPMYPTGPNRGAGPAAWEVWADLIVYVAQTDVSDGGPPPMQLLNAALDRIERNLRPLPGAPAQTLGGLVEWARIEGPVLCADAGELGERGLAVVGVKCRVTRP